jgi:IS4 transposase
MILGKAFEKFADGSPVCVMIRGSLEYALSEEFVNEIFETTAVRQYTRDLLFSDVVDVMASVVCQVFPSVSAAYTKQPGRFSVSRRALYDKIAHVEPGVIRELVRQTAQRLTPVVEGLRRRVDRSGLLPGYRVRILDGNHLAATEHRLKELREIASGPLPGQALVVFDPDLGLVVDVFPCEDAYVQERRLVLDVLSSMGAGEVWIEDRNFCTSAFLFQTDKNDSYFIVRQHETNVRWQAVGRRRKVGRTETGMVYEQDADILNDFDEKRRVRRITIKLDQPTEEGDTEIHLFTNLPKRVRATRVAEAYRGRWRIEGAFGELATALHCEISSLGYPPAALFSFGIGLIAYNILSIVRTALAAAHGEECLDEISAYYVADEIRGMMRGMMVAIPAEKWGRQFGNLTPRQMVNLLVALAKRVNLKCFRKYRRGPKKEPPPRTRYKRKPHVSTARVLAASRGRKVCML